MILLYTKDHCPQCDATKRWLKKYEIEYRLRNVVGYLDELRELGATQAPVVVLETGDWWQGFRVDRLEELR